MKRLALQILTGVGIFLFAMGMAALTNWLETFLAGKLIMWAAMIVGIVVAVRMIWEKPS